MKPNCIQPESLHHLREATEEDRQHAEISDLRSLWREYCGSVVNPSVRKTRGVRVQVRETRRRESESFLHGSNLFPVNSQLWMHVCTPVVCFSKIKCMVFHNCRWLAVLMEALGSTIVVCVAVFSTLQRDSLSTGLVGISITYALQVGLCTHKCSVFLSSHWRIFLSLLKPSLRASFQTTVSLNGLIRSGTELETYMVSVERIEDYCGVQSEASSRLSNQISVVSWDLFVALCSSFFRRLGQAKDSSPWMIGPKKER